jgi:hypothetical protein
VGTVEPACEDLGISWVPYWAVSGYLWHAGPVNADRSAPAAPTGDSLPQEVRQLLRGGLPVRTGACGPALLGLRGVKARSLRPEDPASRARALDGLLREQLDRFENAELAAAARMLFGAVTATSGATLTARRLAAAAASGYEVHHFRKRIEPKITELLAWQLRRDAEQMADRPTSPPELHAAAGPLVLPADVFAWEAAEHQHALAMLWGAVYLLRAELLSIARLASMDAPGHETGHAASAALWRHAQVLAAVARYRGAYGDELLAAAGQRPAEIAAYAGWTPPLTPPQELLLAELGGPEHSLDSFTARLNAAVSGTRLAAAWQRALTGRDSGPCTEIAAT